MKKSYIYKPLLFVLFFFLLDKIFLLDYFRTEFLQDGNVIYYRQREMLLTRLQSIKKEKKQILIFGDSRAYAFSDLALEENIKKKWEIWNFSAPQAAPIYSFYMLDKIIRNGIKPDVVFFVISPEGFDDSKRLIHSPFLRLGADRSFIQKYWDHFPFEDRKNYIMDHLFVIQKIELNIRLFYERLIHDQLDQYDPNLNTSLQILNAYKGENLGYNTFVNDEKQLTKHSVMLKSVYLKNFHLDETQFYFTEKFLQLAAENGIRVISIWPKVYPEYRKSLYELGLERKWWPRIMEMSKKFKMKAIDYNKESSCELYYDASHQSAVCIKEQTDLMISRYLQ